MRYKALVGREFGYDRDTGQILFKGQVFTPELRGFGRDFYVDSVTGNANSSGKNPDDALATIVQATAKCRANKGDRVIVLEGHTETISAATALCAVAGVTIIGLGIGRNRPTITIDTATSAGFTVAVDNIRFINMRIIANLLSIVAPFVLSTAKGFRLQDCKFMDTSGILNFLNIVKSTGAANTVDGLHLENNSFNGLGTTSVNSFLLSANDIDGLVLKSNRIKLARTATAAVLGTISAGVLTDAIVEDNTGISQQVADTGGGFINVGGTTNTGLVRNNLLGDLSTTDLFMTTNTGFTFDGNKKTGVITASGYLLPATDS